MVYKRVRVSMSGGASPYKTLLSTSPGALTKFLSPGKTKADVVTFYMIAKIMHMLFFVCDMYLSKERCIDDIIVWIWLACTNIWTQCSRFHWQSFATLRVSLSPFVCSWLTLSSSREVYLLSDNQRSRCERFLKINPILCLSSEKGWPLKVS